MPNKSRYKIVYIELIFARANTEIRYLWYVVNFINKSIRERGLLDALQRSPLLDTPIENIKD